MVGGGSPLLQKEVNEPCAAPSPLTLHIWEQDQKESRVVTPKVKEVSAAEQKIRHAELIREY
jgi:hypothetical protein